MLKIMSDTSTLYSPAQAEEIGLCVVPLSVTINGTSYREFEEIGSKEFVEIINQGHMPTSSQPAVGEVLDAYHKYADCEILNISMADGLSGTYASAVAAKQAMENGDHVTVVNSKTLCGPHRYMVQKAVKMASEGFELEQVLEAVNTCIESAKSFLIPKDFDYLKRGGRLTPLAANVGGLLKLVPILTPTKDVKRLEKSGLHRTFEKAIEAVIKNLQKIGVDERHLIFISHGDNETLAQKALGMLKAHFPNCKIEVSLLSPSFITQGGPSCVAVQSVLL